MTVATGSRKLKVGLMLPQTEGVRGPGVRGWSQITEMATLGEDIGLDSLWLVDHLMYQLQGEEKPRGVWEVWSLLSALAATTQRVELGTLVLAMGWRNPALLAKMADTVEEISQGRLILGVGSGYHKREFDAYGFPFGHKVSRFEEAIQILCGLLREGAVDFEGTYHRARECELRPRGPRANGPPILIGTNAGSTRMQRLTARHADIFNVYYDNTRNRVDGFKKVLAELLEACRHEGREPTSLEKTATVLLADSTADPWWDRLPTNSYAGEGPLIPLTGQPADIAEELNQYQIAGASQVQICLEPTNCQTIEALAPVLEALDEISV